MKKIILVDGNNLLFRSYYATAYSGNLMKNSKGFPTNGLFGFVNMMNKIIHDEEPLYVMVAFDIGKTFRHEKYTDYKGGRSETPDDLKRQFPVAKEILSAMGIRYIEVDGYEADDIIGTYAKMVDDNDDYEGLIVSSDKDLLQLISKDVKVKLLKSKDYIMMDEDTFKEMYGVEPIRMTDLKGLMGDASDNIPGVKGIGEKTAIKLLSEYNNLDNLYDHIDEVKGSTRDKLINGRDSAFMSREIATIYREVPVDYSLNDFTFDNKPSNKLIDLYKELEFNYFIQKIDVPKDKEDISFEVVGDVSKLSFDGDVSIFLDVSDSNYHKGNIIGVSIYDGDKGYYIPYDVMGDFSYVKGDVFTYDAKKCYVSLVNSNKSVPNMCFDVMIACYLLNYNVKDDIASVASSFGCDIPFYDKKENISEDERMARSVRKAKFIYDVRDGLISDMKHEGVLALFNDIEMPLSGVLARMEIEGICCDTSILDEMGIEIQKKIDEVSKEIYNISGVEFNISSPKQLGEVLFDKMGIVYPKKKRGNYSTDEATLSKIKEPIVSYILTYRMLTKLYSTYIEGLKASVMDDGKIHTIYTQTLTRTGRLSSIEPNLQNIPARSEYGRLIRKCFVPSLDSVLMSSDYSQIELRIFAALANVKEMIQAFKDGVDIHRKTASDVNHVSLDEVTPLMRRNAKAVNFGIIYGISSYGLAEDLGISPKEAKKFIDDYFNTYPGIKSYMDEEIKRAYDNGYVKTIMNRKRVIDEIHNSNYMIRSMGERMALNTPIQGSSADILKKAMILIDKEFMDRDLKSKMLLQVHDELIFNVFDSEKNIVEDIVKRIMESVVSLPVPLVVDIHFGKDLYETK